VTDITLNVFEAGAVVECRRDESGAHGVGAVAGIEAHNASVFSQNAIDPDRMLPAKQ
jgi:hypothetical protein